MAYIEVKNLSFEYSKKDVVLEDVSFMVEKGEWVSIIGRNGSGKTTIAKLLMGLLEIHHGSIKIDDLLVTDENIYEVRKKIGIVFQNPDNQFVGTTVIDDIAFGLENLCVPRDEMIKRIDYYLEKTKMENYKFVEPHQLSGGQKQKVAVAGILAMKTDIIILDEATSMLDPEGKKEFVNTINELKEEGKTIISITHDMNEVLFSDKVIVLDQGKIVSSGNVEEVMRNRELLESSNLELPKALEMYYQLEKSEYQNKEVMDTLWELVFKK